MISAMYFAEVEVCSASLQNWSPSANGWHDVDFPEEQRSPIKKRHRAVWGHLSRPRADTCQWGTAGTHLEENLFFFFLNLQLNTSIWPMCPEERTQGLLSPEAFYCHRPEILEKRQTWWQSCMRAPSKWARLLCPEEQTFLSSPNPPGACCFAGTSLAVSSRLH